MRIFHKLFLLLSLTAMVSALSVAGVLAWNLDRGFGDYLDARDVETMDSFVADFEVFLAERDAIVVAADSDEFLRSSIQQMARAGRLRGLNPNFPSSQMDGAGDGPVPDRPDTGRRGPPPGAFGLRLRVYDDQDRLVFGPRPGPASLEANSLERPIRFDGENIGTARLLPRAAVPRAVDERFLRSQFMGALIVISLLLVGSAVFAWLIASAGVRRITSVQYATEAIACGDLSARVRTSGNDEIAALGSNVDEMAENLEQLESARRRWLAEISHELRTPLTVLTGELAAMEDGVRPLSMDAVHSLSDEAERLNRLIDDLHFLAMSDLGSAPTNFGQIDAADILRDLSVRFGPAIAASGLKLEIAETTDEAVHVFWDQQRIDQLLGNVITNTIRYTDPPGTIRLNLMAEGEVCTIMIEDTPPGVPSAYLADLFEPLHRQEEARDRNSGGSGLGLSVAKAIVLTHGGTINASPSQLGGLCITITLPRDARAA
ncbi:MAG: HAMP domain-containing protein [Erythrobacter sp.]|nr:HAMP domain-containing protein [Erythrobacter sp.]